MQNTTDHAIQNHVCWQGGVFTTGLLSSLTGQQMKKRVQATSAPQGCQIVFSLTPNFTNLTFCRDSWRQKNCLAFSLQYLTFMEAVGTRHGVVVIVNRNRLQSITVFE